MIEIIAIKVFHGESTIPIESKDCHYMIAGFMDMYSDEKLLPGHMETLGPRFIPGIWYKMDATKWHLPIQEFDIFVPMTSVVQIAFKKTS